MYAYVRRRLGNEEDARDSTQAFFASVLEKNLLRHAAADRGRLRSFLLTMLQNFLNNEYQANRRQIRGGGASTVSLDFQMGESQFAGLPTDDLTAERLYERTWALHVLDRVMCQLQQEAEAAGDGERFQVLKPALSGDQQRGYRELARQLATTEAAARQAAARVRQAIGGHAFPRRRRMGADVGVACYPADGPDAAALLARATRDLIGRAGA